MERLFDEFTLGTVTLPNRFVFPPIKLGCGNPDGTVTDRQLLLYRQIATRGPGLLILEPCSVTPEGREHPRQLCVHLPGSARELKKIADVIHAEHRLACLHLNHAGAAANPKVTGSKPKAPSVITCAATGQESEPLTEEEIGLIIAAYNAAARKGTEAGFDLIEIQTGHGYLVSQFLNGKINIRDDSYGTDRLRFAREVFLSVREGAPDIPVIVRISGSEMSPEFGINQEDMLPLFSWAETSGVSALHVGMGNMCFSPPWYFQHGSLPEKPQTDALSFVRRHTSLPIIAAGRMGRRERVQEILGKELIDLVALGRPLLADHGLIEKWRNRDEETVIPCGYCLQGCLHRVRSGEPLGCNLNPELGLPPLQRTQRPLNVLIAGGGPAGMSAALYMTRRGHRVTLAEKTNHLGGQFSLAWHAPGKETMREGLEALERSVKESGASVRLETPVDAAFVEAMNPDMLVWATGAVQYIPEIPGLDQEYMMTSLQYFKGEKEVRGPRVLVIGAGRVGLEVAEKLGREGYEVIATKRTDPLGAEMEMITRNLILKRIAELPHVFLMPHTTVKSFQSDRVDIEQDGAGMSLEPFQTVVVASGTIPAEGPDRRIREAVAALNVIGDAVSPRDIFSAMRAGYDLAHNV